MRLKGQTVLVTGAGGFIGSHLVQQLLAIGANVKAFIRYNSLNTRGFIDSLSHSEQRHIEIVTGDLKDADSVRQSMKGIDTVFHLGASIAIPYSYGNPRDVIETNVLGTLNVARAALEAGVSRMVHTSTSEVYGTAQYVPMDESHKLQGQSPYSASKIAADKIVESFYCSYSLPVVTVRPFNAYGPRQSMRAVIPTIINQALQRREITLGNLSATRDFTYVEDTARSFICAATAEKTEGKVFNAGSGFEISIKDLTAKILHIIGCDLPVRMANDRLRPEKSEVDRLWSNSERALREMGWKPAVSLEEGLRRTVRWISQHRELYRPNEYVV